MIERWLLVLASLLAGIAALNAWRSLRHGHRSRWTMPMLSATFIIQLMALGLRGEMRGACPLADPGEILAFLAWSLVLFYLIVGPSYRVSLLGLFTAPLVVVLQLVALIPGMMSWDPAHVVSTDAWKETHGALSVLSFGALALAAVSGSMYLHLDYLLRKKKFTSGLFDNLPSIHDLRDCTRRLLLVGLIILTIGIGAGFFTPNLDFNRHLVIAVVVWLAYAVTVGLAYTRGLPPHRLSVIAVVLFLISLIGFGLI